MTYSPIALFVYNRPQHTKQTIEALQRNALAIHSDLIIFSDAPKNDLADNAVREVRNYIKSVTGFKSVNIIERETNFGLAKSIINGVTAILDERGRIVVLEDDLIVSPYFLDYMNNALNKYEDEKEVAQISGYMFPVSLEINEDALFLPLTTSWGWATWGRAWELFDTDAKGYIQLKNDMALRKRFNLDGAYDYYYMLEAQLAGRVDSWAVRWYLSTFILGALTLYPRESLVRNTGFDGSGTHGSAQKFLKDTEFTNGFFSRSFPESIGISPAWTAVQSSLGRRLTILDRVKMEFARLLALSK
jgi:glycosyl transferase family 2